MGPPQPWRITGGGALHVVKGDNCCFRFPPRLGSQRAVLGGILRVRFGLRGQQKLHKGMQDCFFRVVSKWPKSSKTALPECLFFFAFSGSFALVDPLTTFTLVAHAPRRTCALKSFMAIGYCVLSTSCFAAALHLFANCGLAALGQK